MTNKKPWHKKWWAITMFVFFGVIIIASLGGCSNDPKPTPAQQQETIAVFDLEALYGKNVDEIKEILGIPSSDTEPRDLQINIKSENQLAKEWNKTWEKDGYELLVSYTVATREVIDFFVSTNDPSGATKDLKKLEGVVGAKSLTNFTIYPVKAIKDPSIYTGIRIIPKK